MRALSALLHRFGETSWWLLAALGFILVALLRPTVPFQKDILNSIFVIDVSQSMNTRDYQIGDKPVSRIQGVRDVLRKSLAEMPCGSRLGLAIFAEYRSFLLLTPVEVCNNYAELSASINQISGKMAWAGGSEIAKGLNWGLKMAVAVEPRPSLVFITDGHEAPPINLRNRPRIDVKPGDVRGMIIGVGGGELSPIPKFDPDGNALGFWRADEVAQIDVYSQGRASSVSGEKMADVDQAASETKKRTPTEHLSSIKEAYLQQLAQENGLGYARLVWPADLVMQLSNSSVAQRASVQTAIGWLAALFALFALLTSYLWRRRS
jgi:mxaL protein